jgi:hypothetical protein
VIVVDEGDRLRIITQPDHARFGAELLSLWRADELPAHPRRDRLLLAVREHDNGWREADAAPMVDRHRRQPFDFTTYPLAAKREIWQRGIFRYAASEPYIALLIAFHAQTVHQPSDAIVHELLDELEPRLEEWLEQVGLDRETIADDYRWLSMADGLSLAVCTGSDAWSGDLPIESRLDSQILHLRPFPLTARYLPKQSWGRDSELGGALARARWTELSVRVAAW